MKKSLFFLLLTLVTIFTGCSSTYTLKDYSSKQKFYKDFNNFAKNKNVIVTLNDDSSFTTSSGAVISNDTLFQVIGIQKKELKLKRDKIKGIENYNTTNYMYPVYKVILKNGKELKAAGIKILPSSSIELYVLKDRYGSPVPINRIKKISYKDHLLGVPIRLITGAILGFASGWITDSFIGNKNLTTNEAFYIGWGETSIGAVAGFILGLIDGYTYTYQFTFSHNPYFEKSGAYDKFPY